MTKLKDEICKAIGDTKHHKENVWRKLEQPKKKHVIPIFISASIVVVAVFWMFIMFSPVNEQQTAIDPKQNELLFTVLHEQQSKPAYIKSEQTILVIEDEAKLREITNAYKFNAPAVDFTNTTVVLAQFISDGCGKVVDRVKYTNNELTLTLALPEHLRTHKEIECTSIAMPNVVLVSIDNFKEPVMNANFSNHIDAIPFEMNHFEIDDLIYNFEILYTTVPTNIVVKNLEESTEQTVTDSEIIRQIQMMVDHVTAVPGIADMAEPQYELVITGENGEVLHVFLWFDEEYEQVTIQSSRNTHQIYQLTGEHAATLLQLKEW